jgi:chemotaxis protein CheC
MSRYTELQLDGLRELANIGSGTAATALSQMLGRPIDVGVPTVLALSLADAVDAAGPADAFITAIVLPIEGDVAGMVLMLFPPEDAATLCGLLGADPDTEVGRSALGEIGNILGSAYVGAFATMTGLGIEPQPPATANDMLGAVVASVLAAGADTTDLALLLDSDLIVDGAECSFSFMLLPSQASVDELLTRLGLD